VQIGTTKGTGGDILILEEEAYCDEGFFYETVAPILSVGSASLVAISTLTSEINFYTRLIKMIDPCTGRACFTTRCIELVCAQCKESGRSHECVHMLHLVPRWQSAEKHRKLKIMMQDRPDLIRSELAGLAFSSLQQVFRQVDIDKMFAASTLPFVQDEDIFLVIDPAAGGPSSDYAVVSFTRQRGVITVSHAMQYVSLHSCTNSAAVCALQKKVVTSWRRRSRMKRVILAWLSGTSRSYTACLRPWSTLSSRKKTASSSACGARSTRSLSCASSGVSAPPKNSSRSESSAPCTSARTYSPLSGLSILLSKSCVC
jgi:hypothetical protein